MKNIRFIAVIIITALALGFAGSSFADAGREEQPRFKGVEFPPKAIRKEIASAAKKAKIELTIAVQDQ